MTQKTNTFAQPSEEQLLRQQDKLKKSRQRSRLLGDGFILGGAVTLFLAIETVIVLILQASQYYELYNSSTIFQYSFNVVAVHVVSMTFSFGLMALIFRKRYIGPLIPTAKLPKAQKLAWVCFGMAACMGANYFTNFVVDAFKGIGYELTQPEMSEVGTIPECIALVFATALAPAIFEEFAFRCCALGAIRKQGKAFAVITVSILFGLIHGNMIQFVFAFIVGLILGYITVVTDSVVPAILIHGFNNGLSVTQEIISLYAGGETGNTAITVIIIGWIIAGIIGLIYLIRKRVFLPEKAEKNPDDTLLMSEKLLCVYPGLLLPVIIMIYSTLQYINPTDASAVNGEMQAKLLHDFSLSLLISVAVPAVLLIIYIIQLPFSKLRSRAVRRKAKN